MPPKNRGVQMADYGGRLNNFRGAHETQNKFVSALKSLNQVYAAVASLEPPSHLSPAYTPWIERTRAEDHGAADASGPSEAPDAANGSYGNQLEGLKQQVLR